jgi:hypothetical protein
MVVPFCGTPGKPPVTRGNPKGASKLEPEDLISPSLLMGIWVILSLDSFLLVPFGETL